MIKKISVTLLVMLYGAAGINHFINPVMYINIIPTYLPNPLLLNYISGGLEILSSLLLVFESTRKFGVYLILFLLVVFIPTHIYMIQMAAMEYPPIEIPLWAAWVRLPLQFALMAWAWWHRK